MGSALTRAADSFLKRYHGGGQGKRRKQGRRKRPEGNYHARERSMAAAFTQGVGKIQPRPVKEKPALISRAIQWGLKKRDRGGSGKNRGTKKKDLIRRRGGAGRQRTPRTSVKAKVERKKSSDDRGKGRGKKSKIRPRFQREKGRPGR